MAESLNPKSLPEGFQELLMGLVKSVLMQQPTDAIVFCHSYFSEMLAARIVEAAPTNSAAPEQEMSKVEPATIPASTAPVLEEAPSLDSDFDSSSDAESVLEELPIPTATTSHNRGRRTSVSAESMAPTNEAYEKIVIPKTEQQAKRIELSIVNNFLFKSLDEDQHADVIGAMAEKKVAIGEEVIKQGGVGDFFYVIETGALDVFVSRNGLPAVKVHTYGPGGMSFTHNLMQKAASVNLHSCTTHQATVIGAVESVVWALDRVTFRRMLMENASKKRRMYEQFLEEVSLFVSLEPYERQKIADALEPISFSDGDHVFAQGDVGESFFIVESGEAQVLQVDEHGVTHEFPSIKKGGYFGELALLNNEPRKASIIAKGKLKCATMNKKAFNRLLGPVVDIIKRNADKYVLRVYLCLTKGYNGLSLNEGEHRSLNKVVAVCDSLEDNEENGALSTHSSNSVSKRAVLLHLYCTSQLRQERPFSTGKELYPNYEYSSLLVDTLRFTNYLICSIVSVNTLPLVKARSYIGVLGVWLPLPRFEVEQTFTPVSFTQAFPTTAKYFRDTRHTVQVYIETLNNRSVAIPFVLVVVNLAVFYLLNSSNAFAYKHFTIDLHSLRIHRWYTLITSSFAITYIHELFTILPLLYMSSYAALQMMQPLVFLALYCIASVIASLLRLANDGGLFDQRVGSIAVCVALNIYSSQTNPLFDLNLLHMSLGMLLVNALDVVAGVVSGAGFLAVEKALVELTRDGNEYI